MWEEAFGAYYNGVLIGTGNLSTFGPVGNAPNANAASVAGSVVTLEPASDLFPGLLSTVAQNVNGVKSFFNSLFVFNSAGGSNTINIGQVRMYDYDVGNQRSNLLLGVLAGNFTGAYEFCTLIGSFTGNLLGTALHNTFIGYNAGSSVVTGGGNTCLGYNAGSQYTSNESSNIIINHNGVNGESNQIRIGTVLQQNCLCHSRHLWQHPFLSPNGGGGYSNT